MWPLVKAPARVVALLSLALLLLPDTACAQGDANTSILRDASRSGSGASSAEPTCESRTVNYITHSLPQQCLTTGPIASRPIPDSTTAAATTTASPTISADSPVRTSDVPQDTPDPEGEELSTGAFMSFEEWKAMMLAKSGPEALEAKPRRQKDGRADAGPGEGFDSLGDEGEISFDFDAYSDKISEIASSARPREQQKETKEQVEMVTYDEGFTYYRSKDAGTTCKERFSYSSFDAGATVKKTSPGAKNPTAILVENKDSYMLLECGMKNKFFIVELSDVILVDTVVIANFEFFSSMIRQFRVSISDRYPVKLDKWKVLGTFEARNSRDIQPFLVENPQDWARYLRVEILSHYGNEYYCPVSLLRVHGLRMLDSWKQVDPSEFEGEDESPPSISEPVQETVETVEESPVQTEVVEPMAADNYTAIIDQSCWTPYWDESYFEYTFARSSDCARADGPGFDVPIPGKGAPRSAPTRAQPTSLGERHISAMPTIVAPKQTAEPTVGIPKPRSSVSASAERPMSADVSVAGATPSGARDNTSVAVASPPTGQAVNENATIQNNAKAKSSISTSIKPPSSRSSTKASSGAQATVRNNNNNNNNKTSSTATSPPPPTPTVQDSFFKALTKRLQMLESNSTLSLQYIESQSRFLQEALARLERRQVSKVDLFLDRLNNTVLGELREVRTLYDHIWQSTVIALESQREQAEHEIVALSTRVGVLADEVVFQKRMAIVQSVLLLGCLVLVIFSRGFAGSSAAVVDAYYNPGQFLAAAAAAGPASSPSSRLNSPALPSTPRAQQLRGSRLGMGFPGDQGPANNNTPQARSRTGGGSHFPQTAAELRANGSRSSRSSSSRTPESQQSRAGSGSGSKGTTTTTDSDSGPHPPPPPLPPTPNRALSDPAGMDFHQPPTPSSIDDIDMAYDSEPAMTPNNDFFSAATSVDGDPSVGGGGGGSGDGGSSEESDEASGAYTEMLARQAERQQLTPTSDAESSAPEYVIPRPGRPGLTHSGSTRKPLPALPEDPD